MSRASALMADCLADDVMDDSYLLVDASAALTSRKFAKDLDAVVGRAKESGVQKVVVRATNAASSAEALRLCRLYPETLFCSAGVSAHESRLWTDDTERQLNDVVRERECVAIGECGLDFSRAFSSPAAQLEAFERQLQMATRWAEEGRDKALLIREVDAHTECAQLLKAYPLAPKVIQFRGSRDRALLYVSNGAFVALSGLVCKDKTTDGVQSALRSQSLPLSRLLLQSDSPYAFPNVRSQHLSATAKQALSARSQQFLNRYCTFGRNEPCSLAATAELVGALCGSSGAEVALQTTFNALKKCEKSGDEKQTQ